MVQEQYFKSEYDLAREMLVFDQIGDWDQSTVINETYAFLLLNGSPAARGRDRELVVKRYCVGPTSLYIVRTRDRVNHKSMSDKALTFIVKNASVKSRIIDCEEKAEWISAEMAAAQLSDTFNMLSRSVIDYASDFILNQPPGKKFHLELVHRGEHEGLTIAQNAGFEITVIDK